MSKVETLERDLRDALKPARELAEKAKSENRDLTEDEQRDMQGHIEKGRNIRVLFEKAKNELGLLNQIDELGSILGAGGDAPGDGSGTGKAKGSMGDQFVRSPGYKSLMERGFGAGTWTTGPVELEVGGKTLLAEGTSLTGEVIGPDRQPGVLPYLFERLTVADLLAPGNTMAPVVRYLEETTSTNNASTVAEGITKPESALAFTAVDESVRKIATILPVTDEMLEDWGQIRSYIDARLRLFVQLREEQQLLTGNGVAPDLRGIMNRTGVQSQALSGDTRPDAVYKAITKIRVGALGLEPDAMVIHPNDWQDFRLQKDAVGGQYFGGGPFTGAYGNGTIAPDSLWGLRVVVTTAMTEGTALVGAFRTAAQIFRKGGIAVEASNSHSTFFAENKTAIRAEERLALAVYRPAAFCKVTGI